MAKEPLIMDTMRSAMHALDALVEVAEFINSKMETVAVSEAKIQAVKGLYTGQEQMTQLLASLPPDRLAMFIQTVMALGSLPKPLDVKTLIVGPNRKTNLNKIKTICKGLHEVLDSIPDADSESQQTDQRPYG